MPPVKIITMTLSGAEQAHLLPEALSSAPFADLHLVVDTSPERPEVGRAVEGLGRPCTIRAWPWRGDFSAARNSLLHEAETLVDGVTWGVVLDSDERFVSSQETRQEFEAFERDVASATDTTNFYTKERAFRLPSSAKYVGPTHEACITVGPQDKFRSLKFWELSKTPDQIQKKLRRDITLLRAHVKKNPSDPRWWYYLGDTLDSLGQKLEAVDAFMSCTKLRGWDEESAWACYRAASIMLEKEQYREAIETSARGLARHPGVAELCWVASVASFRSGLKDKAAYWSRMAIAVGDHAGAGVSHTRTGFRNLPALFELPYDVLRFAAPTQEERDRAEAEFWAAKFHRYGGQAEEIALRRGHDGVQWEARNDIGKRAKTLDQLAGSACVHPIRWRPDSSYHCMNPSVCVHKGKLLSTIRTVNYLVDERGAYVPQPSDGGIIKTENYLADVSGDFSLSNVRPIENKSGVETLLTGVVGYEDLRLAPVGDRLYASATVRDRKPHMPCEIAVVEIDVDSGSIVHDWLQPSDRDEKNWMPVVGDDELSFLYSVDPTVVRRFDREVGRCQEVSRSTPRLALEHLRGGSQVVAVEGGWLAVTHEVALLNDRRCYLHRFVRLDGEFRVTHVSHAWRIRPQPGIEFVAGMASCFGTLVLSVGLDDREACFVTIALGDAVRLASAIPDVGVG